MSGVNNVPGVDPKVIELADKAGCRRGEYDRDWCVTHMNDWPYDERACDTVRQILGFPRRRYLGDGRAAGLPNLPVK